MKSSISLAKSSTPERPSVTSSLRRLVIASALALSTFASPQFAAAATVIGTGGFQSFGGSQLQPLCLDVLDAGSKTPGPGTRLDSYYCANVPGQTFSLVSNHFGPGTALKAAVGSNLCIGDPDGLYEGAPVALEECDGREDQNWAFQNGTLFYGLNEEWCLDVHYASTSPSTPVDVARCNLTDAQIWWPWGYTVQVVSNVAGSEKCLDDFANELVYNGRVDNGSCNSTNAQAWQFTNTSAIRNVNGGVLQAQPPDSTGTGAVVLQNSFNEGYQGNYWYIQYQGSAVQFVNFAVTSNGKQACLDVYGDNPAPNTTVDLFECNATNAQIWQIYLTAQ